MAGYPFDLGTYTRPVSTASPAAQAWFDRGLLWSYGFNHEEAVRCFERAVEHDPGCALAHWGIAYAAGPNYNKDWDAFDAVDLHASLRRAHAAVTSAREAAAGAADVPAVARVPESRYLFNNTCLDILAVAAAMLDGELAYREGAHDEAFAHLRRAIELDDTLPYDEPWGWMQPTRHAYGALLLEQGQVELAEAVYAADLGLDATLGRACQHPGNVWSLHGYHECLTRLGKNDAARVIAQQLKLTAARADVPIRASCACRMSLA